MNNNKELDDFCFFVLTHWIGLGVWRRHWSRDHRKWMYNGTLLESLEAPMPQGLQLSKSSHLPMLKAAARGGCEAAAEVVAAWDRGATDLDPGPADSIHSSYVYDKLLQLVGHHRQQVNKRGLKGNSLN